MYNQEMEHLFRKMRSGSQTILVTQHLSAIRFRKPNHAFRDWVYHLKRGERMPRGRFFVGKKTGRSAVIVDEFYFLAHG
ncbi:TPA_asm: hypothetical protein G4Y45_004274 [Salmonella enterica subsp. enterica serovar Thompson]|nr:hypothetical protein [Salmonella enterica subsp. enterica serovar Thompson]